MPDLMTEGLNERWEFETAVCGANSKSKYKEDCYYYSEIADMGAHIPHCDKEMKLDNFNCIGCKKFRSKNDVAPVVCATWLNEDECHKCSKCGAILEEDFYWHCHNYCYHCGAKMDVGKIY